MSPHTVEIALNLTTAWAAGSLIGMERSYNGRAAGFRTHALVALAAASVMIITLEPVLLPAAFPSGTPRLDPSHVAQGVMTGVGFLGAGVIFKEGLSVQGLTTAACIWATAAIGMLFGLGLYYTGALTTAAVLTTLIAFRWLESAAPTHVYAMAVFRFRAEAASTETALRSLLDDNDIAFNDVSYRLSQGGALIEYHGALHTRRRDSFPLLAERLRSLAGLVEYELDRISK